MAIDRAALQAKLTELLGEHAALQKPTVAEIEGDADAFVARHLKDPKGAVLVSYAGSRKQRGGESERPTELVFDISVISRRLSGADSALTYLSAIEVQTELARLTVGEGAARTRLDLRYDGDEYVQESRGAHLYAARVACVQK